MHAKLKRKSLILALLAGLHVAAADEEEKPSAPKTKKVAPPTVSIDQIQALVDAAKYPEAVKKGREYLEGFKNPLVYTLVGFSLRKQKKWDESVKAYHAALEIDKNFHQAKEYLAVAYLHQKKTAEAKALYQDLQKSDPNLARMLQAEAKKLGVNW